MSHLPEVDVMDEIIALIVMHRVFWEKIQRSIKIRERNEWEWKILGHSCWFLKDEWEVDCQMIGEMTL